MTLATLFVKEFSGVEDMQLEEQQKLLSKYYDREANFKDKLISAFSDLLEGVLKDHDCSKIFENVHSNPLMAEEMIEKLLSSEELLCCERKLLAQIKTELLNLSLIIDLIYDACHLSSVLCEQLSSNKKLEQILRSGEDKEKIEALNSLADEFGLLTGKKILITLQKIKQNWDNLKRTLKGSSTQAVV
jgi:hypothetical protein